MLKRFRGTVAAAAVTAALALSVVPATPAAAAEPCTIGEGPYIGDEIWWCVWDTIRERPPLPSCTIGEGGYIGDEIWWCAWTLIRERPL